MSSDSSLMSGSKQEVMNLSNVQIDKDKLDELAMKVYGVSDDPVPMTVDDMIESLDVAAHSKPVGTTRITSNGEHNVKQYETAVVAIPPTQPVISPVYISPRTTQQVFNDPSFDGYKPVTVYAMPTGELNSSLDFSVSTQTNISVSSNGLITASVDSHGWKTPVTTSGYIENTSSVPYNITGSKTQQLTTKAAATIRASTSQQTIASGTYLTGTQTIAPVSQTNLSAENIKSGTTISISNGQSNIWSVTGTYTGGGGSTKNFQAYIGRAQRTANSYGATTVSLTVAKTGTYNVSWTAWRSSSSGTMGTNLYRNSTAGTNQQTFTGTYGQNITLTNQSYTQGDVLTVYATSGSTSRSIYVANLIIEEQ